MKGKAAMFIGTALATILGFYVYDNYIATSDVAGAGAEGETEEFRGRRFGGNMPRGRSERLRR
jgi:hypothetical protein